MDLTRILLLNFLFSPFIVSGWQFKLPTLTSFFDPKAYVFEWSNKVFNALGINFFDGDETTTFAPLQGYNLPQLPISRAREFAFLAASAYCFDDLTTWTCVPCKRVRPSIEYLYTIQNKTLKAFFAVDHKEREIILAFRGSQNAQNFARDLDVYVLSSIPFEGNENIRLHHGFYDMTIGLYEQVVKVNLPQLIQKYPAYKVVLVGHSLGGSQAALTMFFIKWHGLFQTSQFEVYTYGQPRVGNKGFVDYFNTMGIPVARVTERADVAPHYCPPSLGYLHHQNELWVHNVTGEGEAHYCSTETYEDPACSASLGPMYNIFDHLRYFDADINACFIQEEPAEMLLQFIMPLKSYIPGTLMGLLSKVSFGDWKVMPYLQETLG